MADGRLYYIVGASGVGKDSLMQYARSHLSPDARVAFAHRYITRAHDAGGENHIALSAEEFELRKRHGAFAMDWSTHGYRYGVGTEIHYWLATGLSVVVNGSRGYLGTALESYPDLKVVWVTAAQEVILRRLEGRGRESGEQIAQRVNRNVSAMPARASGFMMLLDNSGPLEIAGERLVALLETGSDVPAVSPACGGLHGS